MLCGSDNRHYVGYAFIDRDFDKDDESLDIDFPYAGVHEDPIASDCGRNTLNANLPIWDPRAYFMCIFKNRITTVLKEWESIVQTIGDSIDRHVSHWKN